MTTTPAMTLQEAMAAARDRHAAGALEEARGMYLRILRAAPNNPEALTLLASIAYRLDDDQGAAALVGRAAAVYRGLLLGAQSDGGLRAALANLLLSQGRHGQAEAVIARATLPFNPVRASPEEFATRRRLGREKGLPGILVNALPKSASESIWNRLAEGLGIAQGHISLGLFPDCMTIPSRARELARGGISAKEHLAATPYNLGALSAAGIDRVLVHVRDPRQAMLSWAYFLRDDVSRRLLAPLWRKTTPGAAVMERPLGEQLDWHIDHYLPLVIDWITAWREVERTKPGGLAVTIATFEAFKADPDAYLARALDFFAIDHNAFSGDAGAEAVHLRKGSIDEWREILGEEQRDRAWRKIPREMAEVFGWQP
jgi:tetratricopeptide (TPR) repeat protein